MLFYLIILLRIINAFELATKRFLAVSDEVFQAAGIASSFVTPEVFALSSINLLHEL